MEQIEGVDPRVPNVPTAQLPNPSVAVRANSDPFPGGGRALSLTSSTVGQVENQETDISVYNWLHSQYEVSSFEDSMTAPSFQGGSSGARNVYPSGKPTSPTPSDSISVRMSRPAARETARARPNQVDDSETGELIGGALYALWKDRVASMTSGPISHNMRNDFLPEYPHQGSDGARAFDNASVGFAAHQNTSSIPEAPSNGGARPFDHHAQPMEQLVLWRPETGPPERFLPPEVESPVPDPVKTSDSEQESRPTLRRVGHFERHQ